MPNITYIKLLNINKKNRGYFKDKKNIFPKIYHKQVFNSNHDRKLLLRGKIQEDLICLFHKKINHETRW